VIMACIVLQNYFFSFNVKHFAFNVKHFAFNVKHFVINVYYFYEIFKISYSMSQNFFFYV
jgi:hypothetical protein